MNKKSSEKLFQFFMCCWTFQRHVKSLILQHNIDEVVLQTHKKFQNFFICQQLFHKLELVVLRLK